jgi:hypothetical protein
MVGILPHGARGGFSPTLADENRKRQADEMAFELGSARDAALAPQCFTLGPGLATVRNAAAGKN